MVENEGERERGVPKSRMPFPRSVASIMVARCLTHKRDQILPSGNLGFHPTSPFFLSFPLSYRLVSAGPELHRGASGTAGGSLGDADLLSLCLFAHIVTHLVLMPSSHSPFRFIRGGMVTRTLPQKHAYF